MRNAVKLIITVVVLASLGVAIFHEQVYGALSSVYGYMQTSTMSILILIAFLMVLVLLYPALKWFSARYELGLASKFIGKGEKKIYGITDCRKAFLDYLHDFGYEDFSRFNDGHRMSIFGQLVNSITSDTPCVLFLASTYPVSMMLKNKISEIPEHQRHFGVVDRRNLEVSYNPSICDWEEALRFFGVKKDMDIPLEKKKTMEQSLLENIRRGFGQSLGQKAVSGVTESPKEEAKHEPEKE